MPPLRKPAQHLHPDQVEAFIRDWYGNVSTHEMARKYGYANDCSIRRAAYKLGLAKRLRFQPQPVDKPSPYGHAKRNRVKDWEQFDRDFLRLSVREGAKRYGVCKDTWVDWGRSRGHGSPRSRPTPAPTRRRCDCGIIYPFQVSDPSPCPSCGDTGLA